MCRPTCIINYTHRECVLCIFICDCYYDFPCALVLPSDLSADTQTLVHSIENETNRNDTNDGDV